MSKLFHISDLHMSYSQSGGIIKNMTFFGPQWNKWYDQIITNWQETVNDGDIVLIGGDTAWPTKAWLPTLKVISGLPGFKCLSDGNHDKFIRNRVGLNGKAGFKKWLFNEYGITYIEGEFIKFGDTGITANMLCDLPTQTFYPQFKPGQFANTTFHLANQVDKFKDQMAECKNRIFLSHYAPVDDKFDFDSSNFMRQIIKLNPTHCLYGHYHSEKVYEMMPQFATDLVWKGIKIFNTSLDLHGFKMRQVLDSID